MKKRTKRILAIAMAVPMALATFAFGVVAVELKPGNPAGGGMTINYAAGSQYTVSIPETINAVAKTDTPSNDNVVSATVTTLKPGNALHVSTVDNNDNDTFVNKVTLAHSTEADTVDATLKKKISDVWETVGTSKGNILSGIVAGSSSTVPIGAVLDADPVNEGLYTGTVTFTAVQGDTTS